jgi:nitroreductase
MFDELVRNARSIRRFREDAPIAADLLRHLVDLARVTPSGGNAQPLRYRVVSDPDECARVFAQTRWAGALKDWDGPAEGERPTGYIVICTSAETERIPQIDIGIAAQTIQLGATYLGYGACQLGSIGREEIRDTLGIPGEWAVRLLLALGCPAETVVLEDMPPGGSKDYWRDGDGVHHVPKRRLGDILLR